MKDKKFKSNKSKSNIQPNKQKSRKLVHPYHLDDATHEEKELIINGTLNDKINCLALLCARNPSPENYKQLLSYVENQRNDVIYEVLKLLRDLIKERKVEDNYIKGRIIKSFEMGMKNLYIKEKVIEIVGVLVRAGIYDEEFLHILGERLGEKGKALTLVHTCLKSVFIRYEELILGIAEDFYYKNDNFRCQHATLKFLKDLEPVNKKAKFEFYNNALSAFDEDYPQEQRDLIMDLLINGLSVNASPKDTIHRINAVRGWVKSPRTIVSVLDLLLKIGDPHISIFVSKSLKSNLIRSRHYETQFLNLLRKIDDAAVIESAVNSCFYYSTEFIICVLLIASQKKINVGSSFGLYILGRHYHPAVRQYAMKLLHKEKMAIIDPYDRIALVGLMSL